MTESTFIADRLSPALRRSIEPDGPRANVLPLLTKLEKHWSDEGDAILASLEPSRAQLVDAGRELVRAIRADWPCVIERFLASADERLARATQHRPAAHEAWNWSQPAQPERIDDYFGKRIELALFQRAGGDEQFAESTALRRAAVEWLERHVARLDAFHADPLGRPPWLVLGAPPKICWLLQLTGIHYRGLWDADGAPWRTQDCEAAARLGLPTFEKESEWSNEICKRESALKALNYTYSPRWTLRVSLDRALRDALEHAPWIKRLLDYHTCVAESPWLSGRLLEASFGSAWAETSRADALALGRVWQQWRFAAAPDLSLWATEHGMTDKHVLNPAGFDQWDWESLYDFRTRGAKPHTDLEIQIARVAMFCLDRLATASSGADRETKRTVLHAHEQSPIPDDEPWSSRRSAGEPVSTWKGICQALGLPGNDIANQRRRIRKYLKQFPGPIYYIGRTPHADPGELRAWYEHIHEQARRAGIERESRRETLGHLEARGNASASDEGVRIKRRRARPESGEGDEAQ